MSSLTARSIYQPQLSYQHLYDSAISKQHVLAKYWIESILGHRLPSYDLYLCLRDGFYLCKIIHLIQNLPTKDIYQLPEDRIQHFLISAQDFGLQSSDLFTVNDLMNGEDMNTVISTILILAHTYSCKRFAGKSIKPLPKRSQSYTFDLVKSNYIPLSQQQKEQHQFNPENITRSKSETTISNMNEQQGLVIRDKKNKKEEEIVTTTTNTTFDTALIEKEMVDIDTTSTLLEKWDPPYHIERPNCIPAYGPYSIDRFLNEEEEDEEDDMYNTKKSNTPSSSGDSGYGTTAARSNNSNNENNKVQDLFEALFAPVAPPPTSKPPPSLKLKKSTNNTITGNTNSKLSLLFLKKKEPHYVKFQTWSSHHQPSTTITNLSTISRPNEETFLKKSNTLKMNKDMDDIESFHEILPPMIKVEKEHPKQQVRRRRTDASLAPPPSTILSQKPQHTRCRSIGTTLDFKTIDTTIDTNILEQYCEEGNLIARYRLGNVIGKGHFGTVYRALDLMSGKTVAVKQINLKDSKKSDIEDMMQEAELLSSLTHTNIVKYEGFIQTKEHMNIVLEFVENGSLLNTLKSFGNNLPEHLVASYCHHILKGLAYLHERDVVHCDLKAANILTTKAGHVKLSDFGVSLNLKLKNHEDNIVSGTPFWMSPEVIELKGASVQSDIWSLGCTIIELCTGKPPYAELITMTAMFKIVEDDSPPLPNDMSDNLHNFLKLCFKKNPHERPTAQMLLHHPWITNSNTTIVKKSNSIILNKYLKKNIEKDDMITLDTSTRTTSMKLMSPSSPYYSSPINSPLSPAPIPPPHHIISPIIHQQSHHDLLPTFQPKQSLFASKSRHASGLSRQSMPVLNKPQPPQPNDLPHVHNLIECSFPKGKGAGQCKVCNNYIKHDALVCKDFCGYICHKKCTVMNNLGRRRASDGPKPMSSVSSQLREKFSFSRKISKDLSNITEDTPTTTKKSSSTWWKKK